MIKRQEPLLFVSCSLVLVLLFLTGILAWHCADMHATLARLYHVRQEYQRYLFGLRAVLHEHMQLKEYVESLHAGLPVPEIQLENESSGLESLVSAATVYWVNRHPEYLRSHAVSFAQERAIPPLFVHLYTTDFYQPASLQHTKRHAGKGVAPKGKRVSLAGFNPFARSSGHTISDLQLLCPLERHQFWVSSLYGPRKNNGTWGFHHGIDLAAQKGTRVRAGAAGTVIEACHRPGYGNFVAIRHSSKYVTRYAHLDTIGVSSGQIVEQGAVIGTVGNTGLVRGKKGVGNAHHLHFELLAFGKHINPMYLLS